MWVFSETKLKHSNIHGIYEDMFCLKIKTLTCGDDTQSNLSNRAVDIRRILHLADVSAVVGEFDLLKYDGGITAHDVTCPNDTLPENAVYWRIWSLLVVEHLKVEIDG